MVMGKDNENKPEGFTFDGWDYGDDFDYENDAGLPEDRTAFDEDNSEDFEEIEDWEDKAEAVDAPATAEDGLSMDEIADKFEAEYRATHDGVMHSMDEIAAESALEREYGTEGIAQDSKDLEEQENLNTAKRRLADLAEKYLKPLKDTEYGKGFSGGEVGTLEYGKKKYAWLKHTGLDAGGVAYLVLRYIGETPYVAVSDNGKGIGYYSGSQAGEKYLPEGVSVEDGDLPGSCGGSIESPDEGTVIKCEKCSEKALDDAFEVYVAIIKSEWDDYNGDDGGGKKTRGEDSDDDSSDALDLGEVFMRAFLGEDSGDVVAEDIDMAKHMKRYHPDGISEHSKCKYIGNRQGETNTRKDYYEQIDAENAEERLAEDFGIQAHLPEEDELYELGLPQTLLARVKGGRPMTEQEYSELCKSVYRVCKDIKDRFGDFRPGVDYLFGWNAERKTSAGYSTYDRRNSHGYLIIDPIEALKGATTEQYFHPDNRFFYDVIRHEIGHSMSSAVIGKKFLDISSQKAKDIGEQRVAEILERNVSLAAAKFLLKAYEENKNYYREEAIAEIFSVYTSPWYKKGTLPDWIEQFAEDMIKGEGMPKQNEMIAQDATEDEKIPERPVLMRGVWAVDPMPLPDYTKPFPFFDDMKWEWVYFNSEEEREARKKELDEIAAHETPEMIKAWMDYCAKRLREKIRAKREKKNQQQKGKEDIGEAFLKAYLGEDYAEDNIGRGVTLDKDETPKKERHRFEVGDSVKTSISDKYGVELGEVRKVDEKKGLYYIEFDETGVLDECEIDWVDKTGKRLDETGYWVDEDGKTRLDDYSVGRWVAFPWAKMKGKVRQIVEEVREKDPNTQMDEWLYICEDPEDNNFLKRIKCDLSKEGRRSFKTREEAEKWLKAEEAKEYGDATMDSSDERDKSDIFDPEQFDQNPYEWGAIYRINQIREQVENQKSDGVTLKQLHEMLRPLREDAIGYAKEYTSPGHPVKKWVQVSVLDVPDTIEWAFKVIAKGEEGSGEDGKEMGKDYFLKWFTCEAIGFINDSRFDGDDKIEVRAKEVDDYYNRCGRYDDNSTQFKIGQIVYCPDAEYDKRYGGMRKVVAFYHEDEKSIGFDAMYLSCGGNICGRKMSAKYKAFDSYDAAHNYATKIEHPENKSLDSLAADEIDKVFGIGE